MTLQADLFMPAATVSHGISTDPMIDQAAREGAWFVFSLSGGKDCGAVTARAMLYLDSIGHPRARRYAIHADLGRAEWPFNASHVDAQAEALGLNLLVVRRGAGDLFTRFERRWELGLAAYQAMGLYHLRGPWSSPDLKFCQSELKIQVMGPEMARRHRGEQIVQVTGLRREESRARRNTPVAKVDGRFAKPDNRAGTRMLMWNPGVLLTTAEVFEVNAEHRVPLSPTYRLGGNRHSCRWCIMGSVRDLEVAARYPDNLQMLAEYVGLEASSTISFQGSRWLAHVAPDLLTSQQHRVIERAKHLASERRAMEAAMPSRHRYVDGWPLYVPDQAEASVILAARQIILSHHGASSPYDTVGKIVDRFAELHAAGVDKRARLAA